MRETCSRTFVAGHGGMVGSAIVRRLESLGYHDIVTAPRAQLNPLDASAVQKFSAPIALSGFT
jgi:GDP-L-fucose synthase